MLPIIEFILAGWLLAASALGPVPDYTPTQGPTVTTQTETVRPQVQQAPPSLGDIQATRKFYRRF